MDLKHAFSKLLSAVLIGVTLFQVFYSASLVFLVYPQVEITQDFFGLLIQEGLIEKAIVYWLLIILSGVYGFSLLFKPQEEIEIYHLVAGTIISVFAIFFVIKTPLTVNPLTDPIVNPIVEFFKSSF